MIIFTYLLEILENVPLKDYTSFKIGGPARYFVEAKNTKDLELSYIFAKRKKLEVFVLGHGTNLLVSDKGFDGLVIKPKFTNLSFAKNVIVAGSGVLMSQLVSFASKHGLTGLEWAAGLPGTVGGAVINNSGCNGGDMSGLVEYVAYFENFHIIYKRMLSGDFGYRHSSFKGDRKKIIVDVITRPLKEGDKKEISEKVAGFIKKRSETQPHGLSIGCIFKNPMYDGQLNSAGYLIDRAGLKGARIGNAQVSEKHGNFIISVDNKATSDDVMTLIGYVATYVKNLFGIELEKEIVCLGF